MPKDKLHTPHRFFAPHMRLYPYYQQYSNIAEWIKVHSAIFFYLHEYLEQKFSYNLTKSESYRTITKVPTPIRIHPINDLIVNCSCKNTKAKTNVMTTLNLSMGTTFDASPSCNAL